MPYEINRSVGKPLEFKGLTGQYVIFLIGGATALFFLFIILRFANTPALVTILVIASLFILLVTQVYRMQKKYGSYGFDRMTATHNCPRFIIRRKSFKTLLKKK